jgi:hypothetical protein
MTFMKHVVTLAIFVLCFVKADAATTVAPPAAAPAAPHDEAKAEAAALAEH